MLWGGKCAGRIRGDFRRARDGWTSTSAEFTVFFSLSFYVWGDLDALWSDFSFPEHAVQSGIREDFVATHAKELS